MNYVKDFDVLLDRDNFSHNTKRVYVKSVEEFFKYHPNLSKENFNWDLVDEYKGHLSIRRKLKPSTINVKIAAITHFAQKIFHVKTHVIQVNNLKITNEKRRGCPESR